MARSKSRKCRENNVSMRFQNPLLYLGMSSINDQGLYSSVRIHAGEIVAEWDGFIATAAELDLNFTAARYRNCSQIGEDQFLVPYVAGASDHVNHSCHPNCGIRGTHTSSRCATSPPPNHRQ